jgi:methionyl aminopeptidase
MERITLLSKREIEKMRVAGKLAAQLLEHLGPLVKAGVSTLELDKEAERWTQERSSGIPARGFAAFPQINLHQCE